MRYRQHHALYDVLFFVVTHFMRDDGDHLGYRVVIDKRVVEADTLIRSKSCEEGICF